MHIKLTEYVRATTLTLNIKDAPRQTSLLIHDAFAKLATDLEEAIDSEVRGPSDMTYKEAQKVRNAAMSRLAEVIAGDVMQPVSVNDYPEPEANEPCGHAHLPNAETVAALEEAEKMKPRRGRPPKVKVEEPAPAVEPTPLEQAVAKAEDEQSQGEPSATAESATIPSSETSQAPTEVATVAEPTSPVSDFDMNSYLAKVCNQSKGAAYKETIYELAKPFVEEGAVPRPSNIKGDDKRWQFIKAVETDSGVKYHG